MFSRHSAALGELLPAAAVRRARMLRFALVSSAIRLPSGDQVGQLPPKPARPADPARPAASQRMHEHARVLLDGDRLPARRPRRVEAGRQPPAARCRRRSPPATRCSSAGVVVPKAIRFPSGDQAGGERNACSIAPRKIVCAPEPSPRATLQRSRRRRRVGLEVLEEQAPAVARPGRLHGVADQLALARAVRPDRPDVGGRAPEDDLRLAAASVPDHERDAAARPATRRGRSFSPRLVVSCALRRSRRRSSARAEGRARRRARRRSGGRSEPARGSTPARARR